MKKPIFFKLRQILYYQILLKIAGFVHSSSMTDYENFIYHEQKYLIKKAQKQVLEIFHVTPVELGDIKNV